MASPDCIFANSSGAAVIPARSLHRVLEVALEYESQDSLFMKETQTEEVPFWGSAESNAFLVGDL